MAAATPKTSSGATPTSSGRLEDQAANAALYATKDKGKSSHALLDEDGKLSSASAATSLKYARPQDLPSYPSPGLKIASAGAAASIADNNKRSIEAWKPGALPNAERAAYAARDYEADPMWQPEKSAAGSKAAAIASDKGANVNIWKARESADGHSAAEQAVRKKISPQVDHRVVPDDISRKALMAATGAMTSSRKRAGSAPIAPIKSPSATTASPSSAQWALKAATQSQRAKQSNPSTGSRDQGWEAAKVQSIAQGNVSRQMFTSNPPVSIEVEEKNRQDTIRASAVAMAQKMYSIQQQAIDAAKADVSAADSHRAARNVHNRRMSDASSVSGAPEAAVSPLYGNNLQEAAQRLAQERLAKMRDEHEEYKSYYGQKSPPIRSRLSIHSKLRRRASSDGAADTVDERQSQKIRSQMSRFQSNVAALDDKKRQKDRDALLAAAQRNVKASMHSMDEEVFQETGKSSPAQQEAWAAKAKEKAQADSDTRMEHFGKVHIGSGKYIDQADVDAVAKSRLQPTFDEMDEKAETQRARETEARLEQEEQKRRAESDKERAAALKAEQKKVREDEKQQEKARKAEEKKAQKEDSARFRDKKIAENEEREAKTKTEDEQTNKSPEQAEEAKPKSKEKAKGLLSSLRVSTHGSPAAATAVSQDDQPTSSQGKESATSSHGDSAGSEALKVSSDAEDPPTTSKSTEGDVTSPASTSKRQSKMKSWFTERLRRSSKIAKDGEEGEQKKAGLASSDKRGSTSINSKTDTEQDKGRDDSIRDVALAGRSDTHEAAARSPSEPPVSPISDNQERGAAEHVSISSSSEKGDESQEDTSSRGRLGFGRKNLGKVSTKTSNEKQHETENRDDDDAEFMDARDGLDDKLEPPPKLAPAGGVASKASASPVRDSKFSENL